MGDLTILQTIVLAIVEGLTEFLPVSSTGHMIITQNLMGIESTPFVKAFNCNHTVRGNLVRCCSLLQEIF